MANYKPDEEYQFSETETPVPYTTEPNRPKPDKDFKGHKKGQSILLVLAIFLAFWAIYKFVGAFMSQQKHKPNTNKSVTHSTTIQQPPPSPKLQSTPEPIQPTKLAQASLSPDQLQGISEQKERLNKLEEQVVNLQTTLSDINTKLSDVSTQVNNLTNQANKPPPAPVEIKKPIPIKKRILSKMHKPHASYSYTLQAAIPGRAWIMRSDGANLTVSLGDRIANYGTVIGIDPNEGVVQTSSGANIKYSPH